MCSPLPLTFYYRWDTLIEDAIFPLETSQAPLFNLLGSEPEDKLHTRVTAAHGLFSSNRSQVVRESLDWLDKYIGPVN